MSDSSSRCVHLHFSLQEWMVALSLSIFSAGRHSSIACVHFNSEYCHTSGWPLRFVKNYGQALLCHMLAMPSTSFAGILGNLADQ